MRQKLLIAALVIGLFGVAAYSGGMFQRRGGQVTAGLTSTNDAAAFLVDADGTLHTNTSVTISGLGSLSNNTAAPSNDNGGVLSAIANAAAPSWSEGNQVLLSTDLSGALRTSVTSIPAPATGPQSAANSDSGVRAFMALKSGGTASMTGTTSTQVIAGVASNYLYLTSCSIGNIHASVDTLVDLQDGSGGTVIWTFTAVHGYGGESHSFGDHPLKVPTLSNGVFAVDETTGAAVKVFCNGFASTISY